MEGEIFSFIGLISLLAGILISITYNVNYNQKHNVSVSGNQLKSNAEKNLEIASTVMFVFGYITTIAGFCMNRDSLHYTSKARHHKIKISPIHQ